MTSQLRIAIGGDDAGFSYQSIISRDLASDARVAKVIHVGPENESDKTAYSTFAIAAAEAVANGTVDRATETPFASSAELERLPAAAFPGSTAVFFRPRRGIILKAAVNIGQDQVICMR